MKKYRVKDLMYLKDKHKNWVIEVSRHENFLFFSWLNHRLFIQYRSEVFVALDLFEFERAFNNTGHLNHDLFQMFQTLKVKSMSDSFIGALGIEFFRDFFPIQVVLSQLERIF